MIAPAVVAEVADPGLLIVSRGAVESPPPAGLPVGTVGVDGLDGAVGAVGPAGAGGFEGVPPDGGGGVGVAGPGAGGEFGVPAGTAVRHPFASNRRSRRRVGG